MANKSDIEKTYLGDSQIKKKIVVAAEIIVCPEIKYSWNKFSFAGTSSWSASCLDSFTEHPNSGLPSCVCPIGLDAPPS